MENDKGERIPADGRSGREDDVGRAVLLGIKGDPVPVGMDAVVIDGGDVPVFIAVKNSLLRDSVNRKSLGQAVFSPRKTAVLALAGASLAEYTEPVTEEETPEEQA